MQLIKDVRDINRFREILQVLFEEGFDFLIDEIRLKHKLPLPKRWKESKRDHPLEKRLRLTLERLGPTFIKFGQVMSVRPDLIPKSYLRELEKLQDSVPEMPYKVVAEQIKKEFGRSVPSIFKRFERKPIASASISQVHKAILKDGSVVAVKVQRPEVKTLLEADIEIMFYIAQLLEHHVPGMRRFQPMQIVSEFQQWTEHELDFQKEALHAKIFARNFSHDPIIKIPRIYSHFTTSRILTMEFIEGTELHKLSVKEQDKKQMQHLLEKGFEAILMQVFVHGLFHADPHPGNIIITKNHKLAFVDFGIVGRFSEELKQQSLELFFGVIENDAKKVVDALEDMCDMTLTDKDEVIDEVEILIASLQQNQIEKAKVSKVLEEVLLLASGHGFRLPKEFALFGKTVVTLEGIALEYDPNFQIVGKSKPFLKRLIWERYNPKRMLSESLRSLFTMKKYAEKLPAQTSRVLTRLESGTLKVDIDDVDIKRLSLEIDRSSNRIAYSMLITALLIVGALTINFGTPFAFALPIIPLLSFCAAFVLISILVYSIYREKNMIPR